MTNVEIKLLQQIRDNTKQLERIAKRLDTISRQLEHIDHKDKFISQGINRVSQAVVNENFISELCDRSQMDCENCWKKLHCRLKDDSQINCTWEVEDGL